MGRSALAAACVLAALAGAVCHGSQAFLPAPRSSRLRGHALAAAGMLAVATPEAANAFAYSGEENWGVFDGIDPLYGGMCAFGIVFLYLLDLSGQLLKGM